MLLAFEAQQRGGQGSPPRALRRKRAPGEDGKLLEELEAVKLRLKRFELTHIVERLGAFMFVMIAK